MMRPLAGTLAREACFFAGVPRIGEGPPHRPRHLYHYMLHHPFQPSFVVDISLVWQQKLAAVSAYGSQLAPDPSDNATELSTGSFIRALEARAVLHGAMIGTAYGEGFQASGPVAMAGLPVFESADPDDAPGYTMFV